MVSDDRRHLSGHRRGARCVFAQRSADDHLASQLYPFFAVAPGFFFAARRAYPLDRAETSVGRAFFHNSAADLCNRYRQPYSARLGYHVRDDDLVAA